MERDYFPFKNLRLSYLRWGDAHTQPGRNIVIAHATGYNGRAYGAYGEYLAAKGYQVFAIDFSGHGFSDTDLSFKNWNFFRDQLLALLKHLQLEQVIGIGHSMGGAVMLRSALLQPDRFLKLLLWDPTILNFRIVTLMKLFGNPLGKSALKRRRTFASIEKAKKLYRRHPSFKDWEDRFISDYVDGGVDEDENSARLLCSPESENATFQRHDYSSLLAYPRIQAECHFLIPNPWGVCSPRAADRLASKHPQSTVTVQKGITHFFPFENSKLVKEWLDGSMASSFLTS